MFTFDFPLRAVELNLLETLWEQAAEPRMGELETSSLLKRQVSQAWRRFKRNMRFVTSYPSEVIWEPVARMEHFAWKKLRLWRW